MAIDKKYEFVLIFDVENGNPNGDPDAGNMPRVDPETGHGLVTDVCLKRKIRNYVDVTREGEPGFNIYVTEGIPLNTQHKKAYDAFDLKPEDKKLPKDEQDAKRVTGFMCSNFYDIRTFGAVMSTKVNCGQVRGPVQLNFAKSIDPILPQDLTITRVTVTTEEDKQKKDREMGRKQIVPYAVYRMEGYISAKLAQQTGFDEKDLQLLWESLINLFEHDRSAARGKMASRKLYVFEHASDLGNAPAHLLFDRIEIQRKNHAKAARAFSDYAITVNTDNLPEGVTLHELL